MLESGTTLGPYQIRALIGVGGMGEVYRAHDTKLRRDVAIKVLPASFVRDHERVTRFQRESELLASLNHPNIAAIYGVDESNDVHALVLELVEGETLPSPMPVRAALEHARQIAEALEYAHEKGVIHRDLKPANIKVTPDGKVKLLDFGLAKAIEDPASRRADLSQSPTLTLGATQAGVIIGTAAYMSPEQINGKTPDRRADVWSFGAVLYEMLTGKQAFTGESVSDILATVLKVDPDWSALPSETPVAIRALVQRCLNKDRRQRLQAIGDARIAIEEALAGAAQGALTPSVPAKAARPGTWLAHAGWIAAGILTLALAVLGVQFRGERSAPAVPVRFTFSLPGDVAFTSATGTLAVSPDGRQVLYTASGRDSVRQIYVRSLDSLESRALGGTSGVTGVPFWSADSRMIAFGDGSKLKKIDASGGPPQIVCDSPGLVGGGYWTDDRLVFGAAGGSAGQSVIYQVPIGGGVRSALTRLDQSRRESFHAHPSPLPDGRHFLYVRSAAGDQGGIYVGSLDAKPDEQESKRLLADQASPVYAPALGGGIGHLLFRRDGTLLAQPFDASSRLLAGNPVPIAEGIASQGRFGVFGISPTGLLAYRTGGNLTTELTWFDRQGKTLGSPTSGELFTQISLAPDGHRVAAAIQADFGDPSSVDIWLLDLERNAKTRMTFDPAADAYPVWSPDGTRIGFTSNRSGVGDLYWKNSNGTGNDDLLLKSATPKTAYHWSRDGRFFLYANVDPKTRSDLWVLPLTGERTPEAFAQTPFNESQGQFSPDGRWIAYTSDESGRPEIYVQPFPATAGGGGRWMVSNGGGVQPRWRPDGKELFYLVGDRTVMTAAITPGPVFHAGVPTVVFDAPVLTGTGNALIMRWDVAGSGQRFLMVTNTRNESVPGAVNVVLNWQAALTK